MKGKRGGGVGIQEDLAAINRWLCITRFRATAGVLAFALLFEHLNPGQIALTPVVAVTLGLAAFSFWGLRSPKLAAAPWVFFLLQSVVDLAGITVGIGAAVAGLPALLFRFLYILVIVPAGLVSVRAGLAVASLAALCHGILFAIDEGVSAALLTTPESLSPVFLFFLVAQQSFVYGGRLKGKNRALSQLANRLDDSRQRLAALVDVARTLNSTLEAADLVSRINGAAVEQLRADWGGTFLVDASRDTFRLAALNDAEVAGTELGRVECPTSGWPVIERLRRERLVVLAGSEAEQTPALLTGGSKLPTVLLAGLCRDAELIGFLAVGYATREAPSTETLSQLGAIAEHATIALRNAQLLEEARQASALKSEFVSTVSHELRTPLNVILGYTEMLRDGAAGPLTAAQVDLFDRIDARTQELFDLIEATLNVGRMETGRDAVVLEQVKLRDLLETIATSTARLPRPPDVELRWEVPSEPAGTIVTDRARVALIVRNLVSNAFKFTAAGRVVVSIEPRGDMLVTEVRDTGVGIAPEHLGVVFDMFRQLDSGDTRRHSGVGLGLYIVKQFVDRLGGTVEVESEVGRGSVFRVTLPGYAAQRRSELAEPLASAARGRPPATAALDSMPA